MNLSSCAMAKVGKKQKYGNKSRKSSSSLIKKTTTRFTRSQYFISTTNISTINIVIIKPTVTFFVSHLSYIHYQKSLAILLSLSDLRIPCIPFSE